MKINNEMKEYLKDLMRKGMTISEIAVIIDRLEKNPNELDKTIKERLNG